MEGRGLPTPHKYVRENFRQSTPYSDLDSTKESGLKIAERFANLYGKEGGVYGHSTTTSAVEDSLHANRYEGLFGKDFFTSEEDEMYKTEYESDPEFFKSKSRGKLEHLRNYFGDFTKNQGDDPTGVYGKAHTVANRLEHIERFKPNSSQNFNNSKPKIQDNLIKSFEGSR